MSFTTFPFLMDLFNDDPEEYDFQREQPITDQYMQHISNLPDYEELKPSIGRKILGGLAAAVGGADLGSNVLYGRYNRAVGEHKLKGEGLKEAAELEQKGLGEQRRIAKDRSVEARLRARLQQQEKNEIANYRVRVKNLERLENKDEAQNLIAQERQSTMDKLANIREQLAASRASVDRSRVALNQARTRRTESLPVGSKPRTPEQFKKDEDAISAMALQEVARDPRFSQFYNKDEKAFTPIFKKDERGNVELDKNGQPVILEDIPEELDKPLTQAIAEAKEKIKRKILLQGQSYDPNFMEGIFGNEDDPFFDDEFQ